MIFELFKNSEYLAAWLLEVHSLFNIVTFYLAIWYSMYIHI